MSRSGYTYELDQWELIKWRGQVASAIRGKRGQALLRDLVQALDAMESKRLIAEQLIDADGEVCALGAVGLLRQIGNLSEIDPEDPYQVANVFDIARPLACEIVYVNDYRGRTPEQRFEYMRRWAIRHIFPSVEK